MTKQMNSAIESMERILAAMQKTGAQEAPFNYRIDSMGVAGMGQAVLYEEAVSSTVQRLILCLETESPGSLPLTAAQLTIMSYREATGRLSWKTDPVFEIDSRTDPSFATALCIAASDVIAPKGPSLIDRLLGRRNRSESSESKPSTPKS